MSDDVQPRFKVGETYNSNRRGNFTVLKLEGDDMTVRWEGGEEMKCSACSQEKILANYEREFIKKI